MDGYRLDEEVIFVSRPWVPYASFAHELLGEDTMEAEEPSPGLRCGLNEAESRKDKQKRPRASTAPTSTIT